MPCTGCMGRRTCTGRVAGHLQDAVELRAQRAGRVGGERAEEHAPEAQRLQRHALVLRQQLKVAVQQRLAAVHDLFYVHTRAWHECQRVTAK